MIRKQKLNNRLCGILTLTTLYYLVEILFLNQENRIEAANVAINNRTVEDWLVVDLHGNYTYKPLFVKNYSSVSHEDVSNWPVNTYYWQAPEAYYQWKIYTYGGDLKFFVNHIVTRGDTSGKYVDEPDLVLEGGSQEHYHKLGYRLPREKDMEEGFDKNQTIKMPLTEPGWYYLVEETDEQGRKHLKLSDIPVTRADFSLVLAGLNRSLIRAKYHMDQVEGDLYDVNMFLRGNTSRTVECDNNCSGLLLDDLDEIGLLFDEIRRLAPGLEDGPWRRLAYLTNRANSLSELLSQYLKLITYAKEVTEKDPQETLADLLELNAANLDSRAPRIASDAYDTRLLAQKTLDELLKGLWDRIRSIIKLLNEDGFSPKGFSPSRVDRIVQESEFILRELRQRNLKPYLDDAERELRKAKNLLDKIRTLLIDPEKSAELLKRLAQLAKVLNDFRIIIQDQVLKPVEKANDLVAKGKKKYQALLDLLKESGEREKESENALEEAKKLIEITKKCLSDESHYLEQLPRQLVDLNNSIHEIEVRRSILTQVNPDYQKKYVDKCREHGDVLLKKSQELDGLFNATRDVAEYAVRAANVYINIKDAILSAEKAAKRAYDAAEKAYKEAVPDFAESLADRARESKRKSLQLLEKARKLRDQDVTRLSLELAKKKQIIDQLFEDMRLLANELDQINAGLKQLADKNLFEQLQELDDFLKRLLERIAEILKRLQLLSDIIYNNLLPQYERLSAGSQSSLGNLSQVIDMARKDLAAAIKYTSSSRVSLEKLLKLEAKLDLDLDLLRRKIQLAHQEAASVHVSVMPNSETGVCTRSYFLPAILSAPEGGISVGGFHVRHLSLIWSIHSDEPDSLLLFMGSKTSDEFLAIEMYERRIRLVYQLNSYSPSGTQVLVHPKVVDLNDRGLLSDEAWYLITVSVINEDRLALSVKPVPKSMERDPQQVSQRLTIQPGGQSSRLTTTVYGEADMHFYMGGLPPGAEYVASSELKSNRLSGCLYNLALNEQQIGLWNFKTNLGCEGCMEGASEAQDTSTFSFTGTKSYSTVSQSRQYDRTKYMVSMSVKTSDPNALLFLSISESTNHYLSVFLNNGRVGYLIGKLSPVHINYLGLASSSLMDQALSLQLLMSNSINNNNTNSQTATLQHKRAQPLEHLIMTSKEYNNDQWFKLTAEKDQNKLVLAVEDEFRESVIDDKLLTLDMDQVFFGGVWPLLRPKRFTETSLKFDSLTGCMKDIQIETSPIDLLRRQSYGVENGCSASRSKKLLSAFTQVMYPLPAGRR